MDAALSLPSAVPPAHSIAAPPHFQRLSASSVGNGSDTSRLNTVTSGGSGGSSVTSTSPASPSSSGSATSYRVSLSASGLALSSISASLFSSTGGAFPDASSVHLGAIEHPAPSLSASSTISTDTTGPAVGGTTAKNASPSTSSATNAPASASPPDQSGGSAGLTEANGTLSANTSINATGSTQAVQTNLQHLTDTASPVNQQATANAAAPIVAALAAQNPAGTVSVPLPASYHALVSPVSSTGSLLATEA